jgi:hypothetical protein
MSTTYIGHFPKPLLDDLVTGKWLPVVGAGMSRNAIVPSGKSVPLWDDLGRDLAGEMADYPYAGALDAISAYAHEYGRPRLVERLAEALMLSDARPGEAHRAFCSIFFDIVCTTNLDFLLERQYAASPHYCRPVIDEDQLAVNAKSPGTTLLKLHGDVHHPARLVVTEEDYDAFLDKYPLLSTYLANLLITRTAVLIGYSLDDPDFRQVWQVVGERLGRSRRLAYAIFVDAKATDIARFARRGVKVINLPGSRSRYSEILAAAFDELREYLRSHLISASHVTEEEPLGELSLPQGALTRLCFFAVPLSLLPLYREWVFPIVEQSGFIPVTAADVIAPGDNYAAKIDAIVRRSVAALIDASTQNTLFELGLITGGADKIRTLVVLEAGAAMPCDLQGLTVVRRKGTSIDQDGNFLEAVWSWFETAGADLKPALAEEPVRLLSAREYRAAVISAMTLLETTLREHLGSGGASKRVVPLPHLLEAAHNERLLTKEQAARVRNWMYVRNEVVHTSKILTKTQAAEIVNGVGRIILDLSASPSEEPQV